MTLYAPSGHALDEKGNRVYPQMPLATYFLNAGLSERDALDVELAVRRKLRDRVREKSRSDDPDAAHKYLTDHSYRARVNAELLGEVLLSMGFSREELAKIEQGTKLGLLPKEAPTSRAIVTGIDGRTEVLQVEELDEHRADGSPLARVTRETGETKIV